MMSNIAQARLTSLSQKCCSSIASWRYDIGFNNHELKIDHNYHHNNNNHNKFHQHYKQTTTQQQTNYTPRKFCLNNKQLCKVNSTSSRQVLVRDIMVHHSKYDYNYSTAPKLRDTSHDFMFNSSNIYYPKQQLQEDNKKDILMGKLGFRTTTTTNKKSRGQVTTSTHSYDEGSDNYNNNDKSSSFNHTRSHLVSLLAALGLFKKFNSDDLEEEKAKLSDEQKMKKMKPVEIQIAKGVLSMCDQDYSKANDFFHRALELSQQEANEEREMLVLNLLASNYFEGGDLENAEKLFIDIMKRMIAKDVETTDPAILELSLKLASIYSGNKSTHEKAMKGFKFVINSLLFKLQDIATNVEDLDMTDLGEDKKDQLALLGWSYDWFAKHLLVINDYYRAAEMLKRALEISRKVLGPLHDQTLILLNDVGTTLAMNDDPEEGLGFIQKAVEGAIESQSMELASFYVNLGLVNLKLKKLQEAKRYCEYSIEMASKNQEHHNSAEILRLSRNCLSEVERLIHLVN